MRTEILRPQWKYLEFENEALLSGMPALEPVEDSDELYKVIKPYRFTVFFSCDTALTFTIHEGFIFDGASIPRAFWRLIGHPMQPRTLVAALMHDYLYATEFLERKTADWIFLEMLQKSGVGWIKRNLMWGAVDLFGGSVWRSHTLKSVLDARAIEPLLFGCESLPNEVKL